MRHFLAAALAPAGLSPGMMEAAPKRPLVALDRPADALAPGLAGAGGGTIALPVITAPAHPELLLTARTAPHPITADVDRTTSSHKRLDAVGQSGHGQLRDTRTCRSQRIRAHTVSRSHSLPARRFEEILRLGNLRLNRNRFVPVFQMGVEEHLGQRSLADPRGTRHNDNAGLVEDPSRTRVGVALHEQRKLATEAVNLEIYLAQRRIVKHPIENTRACEP